MSQSTTRTTNKRRQTRKRKRRATGSWFEIALKTLVTKLAEWRCLWVLFSPVEQGSESLESVVETEIELESETETETEEPTTEEEPLVIYPTADGTTLTLGDGIDSEYALLVDVDAHQILATKGSSSTRIYPASMTKLMTLIVAIEAIDDLEDTFTMTEEILSPLYAENASLAGFQVGEECRVLDLLYGAALPSGADATTALAIYVAGSEDAFVELMNAKVEELGLHDTHFMNASGLHDTKHYSTLADIAVILEYCLQNELCKEVISTYQYTTAVTELSPEGILLTDTMFSRMYGTEVEGITILGGKTGYTSEAGHCLASYAQTEDGHTYIAVTAIGATKWRPVFDTFKLYGIITGTYAMTESTTYAEEDTISANES